MCHVNTKSHNKPAEREHGDMQALHDLVSKHTTKLQDMEGLETA